MHYDKKTSTAINNKYDQLQQLHDQLLLKLAHLDQSLKNEKAQEYLMQGVGRRLKIITRCIHNIFQTFPITQTSHLSKNSLTDLAINLHAFFINISGILDNLAWVYICENNVPKLAKRDVGLFNSKTQKHINKNFLNYLNTDIIKRWHSDYSKNYRDALAHRIPLYVPPSILNNKDKVEYNKLEGKLRKLKINSPEDFKKYDVIRDKQDKLGTSSPIFAHSLTEKSEPILIHGQIITDFMTVEELIYKFGDYIHGDTTRR